jgi:hypothetical protein
LRRREQELPAGARVVFVGTGSAGQGEVVRQDHGGPASRVQRSARAVFPPRACARACSRRCTGDCFRECWRAFRNGFRQTKVQGSALQQGGVVVFGPRRQVRHRQVDRAGGDELDLDAVLAALRVARRSGRRR